MKALVIGGGVLGVSAAYYLRRHGLAVALVERNSGVGCETSFANGAMLTPSMSDPWNAPGVLRKLIKWVGKEDAPLLLRWCALPSLVGWGWSFVHHSSPRRFIANMRKNAALAAYSLSVMHRLRSETGISYEESTAGTLKVFSDRVALQSVEELADIIAEYGMRHQVLDRDGVIAKEPTLEPIAGRIVGGIYNAHDESGDAYLYCRRMQELCERDGVVFHFDTSVKRLVHSADRVSHIITDKGKLDCDVIVIAAGSHSVALVRPLGLSLPVRPAKGYSLTMPLDDLAQVPRLPVIDDLLHAAVTPLRGRLRVAGTAEFAGFDASITRTRVDNLLRLLRGIYPQIAARARPDSIVPWIGFRPMCVDGVPVLGRTHVHNVFLSTGHGHLGWTMAAGSGKAVADLIAGGSVEFPVDPYELARFG